MSELVKSSNNARPNLASTAADSPASQLVVQSYRRSSYLQRLAAGEHPAIFVIAGQSGSGKTTTVKELQSMGIEPSVRLMPRMPRPGDFSSERAWISGISGSAAGSPMDISAPQRIFFADHKYAGYYGFPDKPLVDLVKKGSGAALIVGRCVEIPAVLEACDNILPLTPVVPIRMEALLQVLTERLYGRKEAHAGEQRERLQLLEHMNQEDRPQIAYLTDIYGLGSFFSLSPAECRSQGYHPMQIQPTTPATLQAGLRNFAAEAVERSKSRALDLLQERRLDYDNPYVQPALTRVLDNLLIPTAEKHGLTVCLKGGLAVALYLEKSRPVSLDIDFTARESQRMPKQLRETLAEVTGHALQYQDYWGKPIYHVRGINTAVKDASSGALVELDALTITRVQPGNTGFCYVVGFDPLDEFYRRSVVLPSGNSVGLVPPEHIVVEKLAAGRGPELNKFDLFDAAGLLATLDMNPLMLRKIFEKQIFDPETDVDVVKNLELYRRMPKEQVLEQLGISLYYQKTGACQNGSEFLLDRPVRSPAPERQLGLSQLKRLALVSRLDQSLSRILEIRNQPFQAGSEKVSMSQRWGSAEISTAVNRLKKLLQYYAEYELGRTDLYVRRLPQTHTKDAFFQGLKQQEQLLFDQQLCSGGGTMSL